MTEPSQLSAALRGAGWMLLAGASYAVTGAIVRHLADSFSVLELALLRSLIALLIFLPMIVRSGPAMLRTTKLHVHALRAGMTYGGILCWFYGVSTIPLADYHALAFTLPLFTMAMAAMFLGQRVAVANWAAVAVGFGGALVILRPGFESVNLGAVAALAAALSFAMVNTLVKVLSRTDPASVQVIYSNLLVMPLALVPAVFDWRTPGWPDLPWIVAMGAFGTIAQFCITRAIAVADARVVQPFDFARLPIAAAIGYVFFAEVSDPWTWIGAVIIFGAGYTALWRERTAGGP